MSGGSSREALWSWHTPGERRRRLFGTLAVALGLVASVWPAIIASTKPVVSSLRQA